MQTQTYVPDRPPATGDVVLRDLRYRFYQWGEGDGPIAILLHGWGDCGLSFQFLADVLPRHWQLYAPDWRGFGDSQFAPGGYWFPDYLADLDALLAVISPLAPVVLIGHSMGGNVAALYAGIRPARVSALVSLEGFGLPTQGAALAPERYCQWLDQQGESRTARVLESLEPLVERIRRRAPALSTAAAQWVAHNWVRSLPEGGYTFKMDPRHRDRNAVLYRRDEAMFCWRAITAPTLLLAGANSRVNEEMGGEETVEELQQDMAMCLHRCTMRVIADCGHQLHFEQPSVVAGHIVEFIDGLGQAES